MSEVRLEDMLRDEAVPPFLSRSELWRLSAYMKGGVVFVFRLLPDEDEKMIHEWWHNAIGHRLQSEVRTTENGGRELLLWRIT